MKRGTISILMTLVLLPTGGYPATAEVQGSGHFESAFEELKTLTGSWEGQGPEGWAKVTYHLTGMGSALVETFYGESYAEAAESTMSSVYHMDGDELRLTHYCGAQNQPRMKAVAYDRERGLVRFEMFDITNLAGPTAHYSSEVEIEILDESNLQVRFGGPAYELSRQLAGK